MKDIETYYHQYIKARKHTKCLYLEEYFQDTTNETYCFLELAVYFNSVGIVESESIHEVNSNNSKCGVQCDINIEVLKKIKILAPIDKVYDFFSFDFDTDMKQKIINLLNQDVKGVLIPIYLMNSERKGYINILMLYFEEKIAISNLIKHSFTIGKFLQEFPVLEGVIMAEVSLLSNICAFNDKLNKLKPKVSSDENIFNCIMKKLKFPNARTFLTIANSSYEGKKNYGKMLLYKVVNINHHNVDLFNIKDEIEIMVDPKDTNISGLENVCRIIFKQTCPVNWQNAREVRKYLEMSNEKIGLVIAGYFRDFPDDFGATIEKNWIVYGLAQTNRIQYDAAVSFCGDKGFELYLKNERILYNGVCFRYFTNYHESNELSEQIAKLDFLSKVKINLISDIINEAGKQKHGTMLVFHSNAKEESQRLGNCGRALEVNPIKIKNEMSNLVQLTTIDGALMIDFEGVCYALGVILDGNASEKSQRGRGARYNSGLAYVDTQKKLGYECLAIVVSEDGTVDILS